MADLVSPPIADEAGFTLVEVLVALAILGIAAGGLIGAAEAHIDTIRGMHSRAAAQWVAENQIAEITVGAATAEEYRLVPMLGQNWAVRVASRASDDPELAAMTLTVAEPEASDPLVAMDFFIDKGADKGAERAP